MFDAPLARDRLLAARSTDHEAICAGGRIQWSPAVTICGDAFRISGSSYYYHRLPGVTFSVSLFFPEQVESRHPISVDVRRPDVHTASVALGDLILASRQSVLSSDAMVSEIEIRNSGASKVTLGVRVTVDVSSLEPDRLLRFDTTDSGLVLVKSLFVDGRPAVRLCGVAGVSFRPDFVNTTELALPAVSEGASGPTPRCVRGEIAGTIAIAVGATTTIRAALALTETAARSNVASRLALGPHAIERATREWIGHIGSCPQLRCSNEMIERRFATECMDSRVLSSAPTRGSNPYRADLLGTRERRFSDASAAAKHVRSDRWNRTAEKALSTILNFTHFQRADGALPSTVYYGRVPQYERNEADWSCFWDLFLVHSEERSLKRVFRALANYAAFVDRNADPENSGLIDRELTVAQRETLFTSPKTRGRLKGIASTVNQYRLTRNLALAAMRLGFSFESEDLLRRSHGIRRAIREDLWDQELKGFFCVDRLTGVREEGRASESLAPYGTDIVEEQHLIGLRRLTKRSLGMTGIGLPESAPEHVRVNRALVEATAKAGNRFSDSTLLQYCATLFLREIRFAEAWTSTARTLPSQSQGVSPGKASLPSVASLDLIISYMCGVRPHDQGVTIRPLPFHVDSFELDRLVVRNNHLGVWRRGDRFGVRLDGENIADATIGESIELDILP